jgi:heterodisulfide reductase subunit A-like polyferredoxin
MPSVDVQVKEDCIGCGVCTEEVCFIDAISLVDGKAVISEDCRGCGHCAEVCPEGEIKVVIERKDYIDNAIKRLSQAIEVH